MARRLEPMDLIGFFHESRADLSMTAGTDALIWRHGPGRRKGR